MGPQELCLQANLCQPNLHALLANGLKRIPAILTAAPWSTLRANPPTNAAPKGPTPVGIQRKNQSRCPVEPAAPSCPVRLLTVTTTLAPAGCRDRVLWQFLDSLDCPPPRRLSLLLMPSLLAQYLEARSAHSLRFLGCSALTGPANRHTIGRLRHRSRPLNRWYFERLT